MRNMKICGVVLVLAATQGGYATELTAVEQCLLREINTGDQNRTVAQIEALCLRKQDEETVIEVDGVSASSKHQGALSERLTRERITAFNPFVITPHKMNYVLPAYSTNAINREAYEFSDGFYDNLTDLEAMFQIRI